MRLTFKPRHEEPFIGPFDQVGAQCPSMLNPCSPKRMTGSGFFNLQHMPATKAGKQTLGQHLRVKGSHKGTTPQKLVFDTHTMLQDFQGPRKNHY
jgi:hypothetical protein